MYPLELLDTQMLSHGSVISLAPCTAGGNSATKEGKAAGVTCSISAFPCVRNYLKVHIKWTSTGTCPERLLWSCVEFVYEIGLDVFPSYYGTGVRNSVSLDTLRHQFNECRKEVFDPLLKSTNAVRTPVHMLFERDWGCSTAVQLMEREQYLSGVMQSFVSFYSIILPI